MPATRLKAVHAAGDHVAPGTAVHQVERRSIKHVSTKSGLADVTRLLQAARANLLLLRGGALLIQICQVAPRRLRGGSPLCFRAVPPLASSPSICTAAGTARCATSATGLARTRSEEATVITCATKGPSVCSFRTQAPHMYALQSLQKRLPRALHAAAGTNSRPTPHTDSSGRWVKVSEPSEHFWSSRGATEVCLCTGEPSLIPGLTG